MTAIEEVRAHLRRLKREGPVRTSLPPGSDEPSYNPIECAPRKKLERLRDEHLRHIVEWAYRNSAFYRRLWDGAGVKPEDVTGYGDLEKLPVWRKDQQRQDERDHPPFGSRAVKELVPHAPLLNRSTGTTGVPTMHLWVPEDWQVIADDRARWLWAGGARPGGAYVEFAPVAKGSLVPWIVQQAARNIGLLYYAEDISGYFADPEASASFFLHLGRFYHPLCTFMSPEFLITMALQYQKMDKEPPFDVVLPGGTPVSSRLRQELHSHYKKPRGFSNIIGAYESSVANECSFSAERGLGHMHESEDNGVFEVVKPGTNKRVGPGERGELVITSFLNHTLPFIRFSLEDVMDNSVSTEPCGCGRTTKRWLKPCPGRLKDIFRVKGKELMPWDVELVIGDIPDATMIYQIALDSWDMQRLRLKVETLRKLPDPGYQKLVQDTLESRLALPVEAELVPPGAIPPPPGGYKVAKVLDKRPKRA
ncbi:MAG: hypothetical protein AB1603_06750 [Chloroflexota bacterium]